MYRIGEFSYLYKLTIKTLRYYDEIDLFKPSYKEPYTGYRYYSEDQKEEFPCSISAQEFFFFLIFLSYIHVTFGIPRRSAFTSQENVSPSWASITFAFFNPSSPTAFLPKWPPKTAPSPPPRAAPKAAFATSPAPIFPIGFLVIAIVWAPASIGITYGCFAALNFCGS